MELLPWILQPHWIWTQSLPWQELPTRADQNHGGFCRGCASRAILVTLSCSLGWKHSCKYHQCCGCNLQGKWTWQSPKKCRKNVSRLLRQQLRSYKKDNPMETQQKALSVCILCLLLSSKSTALRKQWVNLQLAPTFLPCDSANTPKCWEPSKNKPSSSAFKILYSFEMATPSHIHQQNSIWPTVFQLHLRDKRTIESQTWSHNGERPTPPCVLSSFDCR